MDKILDLVFSILLLDAFQPTNARARFLNEKRRRERLVIMTYVACAFFWIFAFFMAPATVEADPGKIEYFVGRLSLWGCIGFFAVGSLAAIVAIGAHLSYLLFRYRHG